MIDFNWQRIVSVHIQIIYLIAYACLLSISASANNIDDIGTATIPIKVTCIPYFDQGYIEMSVTNMTNLPIKLSPELQLVSASTNYDAGNIISASIVFIKKSDIPLAITPEDVTSLMRQLHKEADSDVDILPGETKGVKVSCPSYYSKLAKAAAEAKVILKCKGSIIQSIRLEKVGDSWKALP